MKIQNLRKHQTNGVTNYYSTELVENGTTTPVRLCQNSGTNGITAFSENTGMGYPIESVNGLPNVDITTLRDGDEVEIIIAVPITPR